MSVPQPALPDLTIWDSIRERANAALENLVKAIEAEIAKDQTLADLLKTGAGGLAIEARARQWMVRAYACCLECWRTAQEQETQRFRDAVCVYCLSPFFSKEILRLLRIAAGVSQTTIRDIEKHGRGAIYGKSEGSRLGVASNVFLKMMPSWVIDLPPIVKPSLTDHPHLPVVSKAPPPPREVGGIGCTPPARKAVEVPTSFPAEFPSALALKARLTIAEVVRQYPDRSKLEQSCKELVARLTELFCVGVRSGVIEPHAAPDALNTIVHQLLVANCHDGAKRVEIETKVVNSDEWHTMLKRLLDCELEPEPPSEKDSNSTKIPSSTRERVGSFIKKMRQHGYEITRKDIWQVAGYDDATEFERFQREDPRTTSGSRTKFDRILNLTPEEFIQRLSKLASK